MCCSQLHGPVNARSRAGAYCRADGRVLGWRRQSAGLALGRPGEEGRRVGAARVPPTSSHSTERPPGSKRISADSAADRLQHLGHDLNTMSHEELPQDYTKVIFKEHREVTWPAYPTPTASYFGASRATSALSLTVPSF